MALGMSSTTRTAGAEIPLPRAAGVLLALAILCGSACNKPNRSAGRTTQTAKPSGPSFTHDIAPTLERSCAAVEGCHGPKPTDSVHLDLRADAAYDSLVGRASRKRKGAPLVHAGDPAGSFLHAKLRGTLVHGEGKRMPLDPDTGAELATSPLTPSFLDAVDAWIKAGAQRG